MRIFVNKTERNNSENQDEKAKNEITLGMINIQGLTNQKLFEIETLMQKEIDIFLITETQLREDKIIVSKGLRKIDEMRKGNDKKGGGLMVIYKDSKRINIEKEDSKHVDLLLFNGIINNKIIKFLLVYFPTGNKNEDNERRKTIRKQCEKIIGESRNNAFIVLGDFNGHVGFLGYQKIDKNGEMIIEWMNDYNLTLLNAREETKGLYTWERGEQKSVIDYVLVNEEMELHIDKMEIDENKELMDISDHNLIKLSFRIDLESSKDFRNARWEITDYITTKKEVLEKFIVKMEESLTSKRVERMEELDKMVEEEMQRSLKRSYKKKVLEEEQIEEKPWINDEIREKIKERKKWNRLKRNENNPEERQRLETLYEEKKKEVMKLVKEEVTDYEINLTQEVKRNRNEVWKNIAKLRNSNEKRKNKITLYDENEEKLSEAETKEKLYDFWSGIYQRHENNIRDEWNDDKRVEYEKIIEDVKEIIQIQEQVVPLHLREHMDMAVRIENILLPMKEPEINKEKVIKCLKKIKNKKAAGPDGIKPEIYKAFLESDKCLETLVRCLKNEMQEKEKPEEWSKSRTKMVEKKSKPTVKDLRPIALTNISYKIFMMLVKNEIEDHIERNQENKENQAGFTSKSRLEDNLFILQYIVEKTFKRKKPLIVISIDFRKAFDSIKREKIVEVMTEYRIHPQIIESITKIYSHDVTKIDLGEDMQQDIEVTSGIRQGCTGSATVFKLITYKIMEQIEKEGDSFKDDDINIGTLFFADDALVIAETIEGARKNIKLIIEEGKKYGLDINTEKSSILAFNLEDIPEEIEGIKTVKEIRYLGITIENKRNMFSKQKKQMIEKAQKLANMTYAIISKSCNKLMIGKTFWKNVALPAVLHGAAVLDINENEIQKLQTIENGVYRKILGAFKGTAVAALKGEVGTSDMKTRVIKNRIMYIKYIINGKKEIVSKILEKSKEDRSKWWNKSKKYIEDINISIGEIAHNKKEEIDKKIKEWDTAKWKGEMEKKESLNIYRIWRKEIKEEKVYDNRYSSVVLFKARSNTLPLNDRNRHIGGSTKCTLCDGQKEDLHHFLLECPQLSDIRVKSLILQQPHEEDKVNIIGNFLFENTEIEKKKEVLENLWKKRQIRIKEINDQ